MRIVRRLLLPLIAAALLHAQPAGFEFWPGASYDPSVPTVAKVLGHQPGERITTPADIVGYLEALAAAAPDRMKVFDYAKSWEGRRLVYAVVGSRENIRRLDEIGAGMRKLLDPRATQEAEARRLMESLPATVWLAYGVHGNEISSPDAAMLTAYHLLAARNDEVASAILKDAVVFIDPLQNPDGRNRFVNDFTQAEGLEPNANPEAAEHDEPWPNGRTNHYLFDMNRDWFALTQPETQGRVEVLRQWRPLVFVDLHEMGSNSTYYFAPEAVPYNPHVEQGQRAALDWFGQNNARWFDQFGFSYFTREIFDAFYPGYGASWPTYYGSVAMTYEQASSRGLLMQRTTDEEIFHFRDTVRHHFVASISTCEAGARNRARLLENFYNYQRTAIEEGRNGSPQAYVFPRRGDVSAVDKLADVLVRQGVEVRRASAAFQAAGAECPAGSYVVSLAQPAKRLIRTLLDPDVAMEEEFLKEQERKRAKRLEDDIYDVVAWSLPQMYNVEMLASEDAVSVNLAPVAAGRPEGAVTGGQASVAYLVPWGGRAAARFLTATVRADLKVWTADKKLTLAGREYPRGTLIVRTAEHPDSLHARIADIAKSSGAEVVAANTGYVTEGISLGSNHVLPVRKPEIALAWDQPTASYAAGATRFVIERQFGYPLTAIRTQRLAASSTRLGRFNVLILPDARSGGYAETLGKEGIERLKTWVANGGTLIGVSGAVRFLADPEVDLLPLTREYRPREKEDKDDKKPADEADEKEKREAAAPGKLLATEEDWKKAIEPEKEPPDSVPGVLAKARLDPDAWVTAGLPETVHVMVRGQNIYAPVKLDKGVNAAFFLGPDELRAGGYLWEENRKQLAYKPFVVVRESGRGMVVGFTEDPNFRSYIDGLNVLFLNAIFRSQAPVRTAR